MIFSTDLTFLLQPGFVVSILYTYSHLHIKCLLHTKMFFRSIAHKPEAIDAGYAI